MPADMSRYPDDWPEIAARIRYGRAGGRCECDGRCGHAHPGGRCNARHGELIARRLDAPGAWMAAAGVAMRDRPRYARPVRVVLAAAHLDDSDPGNCSDTNLMALCQQCHALFDAAQHAVTRSRTRHG